MTKATPTHGGRFYTITLVAMCFHATYVSSMFLSTSNVTEISVHVTSKSYYTSMTNAPVSVTLAIPPTTKKGQPPPARNKEAAAHTLAQRRVAVAAARRECRTLGANGEGLSRSLLPPLLSYHMLTLQKLPF